MKLNIKESYKPSFYTSFGIENDEITYSKGYYPNNRYTKNKLPKNSHFSNIYEFLATCNPFCDNTVPVELSEFNTIDFNKIDSELTLSWVDDNGVYKTIRANLYNYPTYVTNADLNKYGIKLKKDSEVDTLESCKNRKSKKTSKGKSVKEDYNHSATRFTFQEFLSDIDSYIISNCDDCIEAKGEAFYGDAFDEFGIILKNRTNNKEITTIKITHSNKNTYNAWTATFDCQYKYLDEYDEESATELDDLYYFVCGCIDKVVNEFMYSNVN